MFLLKYLQNGENLPTLDIPWDNSYIYTNNTVVLFIAAIVYPNDSIPALIAISELLIESHKNRVCK